MATGLAQALSELPRPGKKRSLDARQEAEVIAMVCAPPPQGYSRWSVRLIAEETIKRKVVDGIGRETIRVLLESHELKPWREKNVGCIPELKQEYAARMEEVLDICQRPHNPNEPVICLDERPVQLLDDARAPIPASMPGRIAKRDSEYVRRGTANVFCAVEPKAGRHFTKVTKNRKGPEFAKMLVRIAKAYPKADTIHLVMDNLNTHCEKSNRGCDPLETIYAALHAKTRQLAQSSGDRNRNVLASMPRQTSGRQPRSTQETRNSLEQVRKCEMRHNQLDVH